MPDPQPTLDLGDYRGRSIIQTAVKLANTNDGFHPSTEMDEPRIFEIGEELTIAIRVKVIDHHPKLIEKGDDEGGLEMVQTFKCGTVAIIADAGNVKKELDKVAERRKVVEAAKKSTKGKPVRRGHLAAVGSSLEAALGQVEPGDSDVTPEETQ